MPVRQQFTPARPDHLVAGGTIQFLLRQQSAGRNVFSCPWTAAADRVDDIVEYTIWIGCLAIGTDVVVSTNRIQVGSKSTQRNSTET